MSSIDSGSYSHEKNNQSRKQNVTTTPKATVQLNGRQMADKATEKETSKKSETNQHKKHNQKTQEHQLQMKEEIPGN